ncbi:MAG: glycosyltransferase family 4 protein [Cyclobacteriaceae bacterium]
MRIGIEAQRIFREKKHGMDIYAVELIKELQQIDHENEYFIFVKPDKDWCIEETHNFSIIEVFGVTYADWEQISLPIAASKYELDVLHCTSNTAPLFCPVPTIVTLHDIIYLNKNFSGGSLYQRLGHYYRKWIVPLAYKKAKQVFTVSNFERDRITALLGHENKLQTVYNGVGGKFKPLNSEEQKETRARLNLPKQYLFFLGNTAPKKNMKGMLEAFSRYCDENKDALPLVIAESSEEDVISILYDLKRTDVIEKIHLTGYLFHHDLPSVYASAALFIYPSLRESFGIPIIEAMACGAPVITSQASSMPEVAGEAACLVNPNKPIEIAQAISLILEDETYYQNLRAKGALRAVDFRWSSTAEKVSASYLEAELVKV